MTIPTIARVLDPALASCSGEQAIVARSGILTYAELDAAAGAAAGALWELGIRPGDRVAACLPNDLPIVAAFLGAQRIGAVWAGIGEALTAAEQQAQADLINPAVILAGPRCELDAQPTVDERRWAALTGAGHAAPEVAIDPHAPAGLAFSSGTTGTPKAVVHSQHNLMLPAAVLTRTRGWGPELRKGDSFPFTILNMLVLSTLVCACARGCAVVIDRRDPDGVAGWIGRAQVTVWNAAPAQLFDLAGRSGLDLSSLTEVWTGGGACPEHIRDAFRATYGQAVTATYGLSEAPTVVAIDPAGGQHKDGASGRVLPHLNVAGYDPDGQLAGPGEPAELRISAAAAGLWAGQWRPPLGYWEDGALRPAGTGQVLTGDIGWVDDGGWLTMVDRKKLMIVRGGANVSPAEVEGVLLQHPGVAAAAVFAVPDDRLGERVAALVVPSGPGLDAVSLGSFCSGRLARYKIPEVWARTGSLPVNAMGKIIRTDLTTMLCLSARL